MKMRVVFFIEDGLEKKVETITLGKEEGCIYIYAASLHDALTLISDEEIVLNEEALKEASEEEPGKTDAELKYNSYYRRATCTVDTAKEEMEKYADTPGGARFVKGLENAYKFTTKKDKAGIKVSELRFLTLLAYASGTFDALMHAYSFGFRKGYKKGLKEGNKKC